MRKIVLVTENDPSLVTFTKQITRIVIIQRETIIIIIYLTFFDN